MPEFYRLDMPKEEINKTLLTAVLEAQPVVAGNFAAFTKDGQIIDSETSAEDFAIAPMNKNLTLYVNADTGSDSNDGLTAAKSKKTIQAAIDAIPKNLGGHYATIRLASGTYLGDVTIGSFYGGGGYTPGIAITGPDDADSIIQGRIFLYGTSCYSRLIDLSIDGRAEADGCTNVIELSNVRIDVTGSDYGYGVRALRSVAVKIYNCTINNAAVAAISIDTSTAYIYNLSGTGNTIAVSSGDSAQGGPALVVIGNSSITGDIKYQKVYGGAILENGVLV